MFLDTSQPGFAGFDPELGYIVRSYVMRDGVDSSRTTLTVSSTGERRMVSYADQPCRLHAYGDSFTQGIQVSDGETWPEYLASHLGEPIRNFGVGGYGVYQAYRRLIRQETTATSGEYLILNIWGIDDHLRSVDKWRWLRFVSYLRSDPRHLHLVHGNPWDHARLNLTTGGLEEHKNAYSKPEDLYRLCDADYVYGEFKDDLIVKLLVAERHGVVGDPGELEALAIKMNVQPDLRPQSIAQTARAVHEAYALRASLEIVKKADDFAKKHGRKLMILLSYAAGNVRRACEGRPRIDQIFIDFIKDTKIPFIDLLSFHVQDFRAFRLSPQEYVNRFFIGHYTPQGNHFFAFAVKDAIAQWLDPRPPAYRKGSETI